MGSAKSAGKSAASCAPDARGRSEASASSTSEIQGQLSERETIPGFVPLYAVNDTCMALVGLSTDVRYAVAVYSPCSGSVKLKDAEALIPPVGSWT